MEKKKVLFVCIHNSARSQMAEAWMNRLCGDRFEAESAGLEPGTLNPLAVAVMKEVGIDISAKSDPERLRRPEGRHPVFLRHHRLRRVGGGGLPHLPGAGKARSPGFYGPLEGRGHAGRKAFAGPGDPGFHPQGSRGFLPARVGSGRIASLILRRKTAAVPPGAFAGPDVHRAVEAESPERDTPSH